MWNQKPSYRFEINNFSEKKNGLGSKVFVSNGSEWYLMVYPKGDSLGDGYLSLYLSVANRNLLATGWKLSPRYYFVVLNQSHEEIYKSDIAGAGKFFCADYPSWGFRKALPLSKLQEKGVLEKDTLIVEVYIEASSEEVGVKSANKEYVDINGFQVFASYVTLAKRIFAEHPDIVEGFKPKNQVVKTAYINTLLKLVKKIEKPSSKSLSETSLKKAFNKLSELIDVGFKLDWLKLKLEELSLEKKKAFNDASRVQQLEERVEQLENYSMKAKVEKNRILYNASSTLSLAQQLETRVKNIELMQKGTIKSLQAQAYRVEERLQYLEPMVSKSLERFDDDESRIQELETSLIDLEQKVEDKFDSLDTERDAQEEDAEEERAQELDDLRDTLGRLNKKLEDSLEKKKSSDGGNDQSRIQQLEESVKTLVLMVKDLKAELEKKKDKSCADGFLLVN